MGLSSSLGAQVNVRFCYLFQRLNSAIIYDRDFSYQYFGFKVCVLAILHVLVKSCGGLVWCMVTA